MTTIGKSMFPLQTSSQLLTSMKERYDKLQGQLATGERAATLAEMGSSRYFNLSMRTRITNIESYSRTMSTVNLRLEMLDTTLTRFDQIEAEQRISATPGGSGSSNINFSTVPATSRARLDEVLDLLNTRIGGRYLFGGSDAENKPVLNATALLDGEGGRAGFNTVAGERRLADSGADNMGRLTLSRTGDTVSLAEDGVHPFGLKLTAVSSSSPDVVLTQPTGAPPELAMQFAAVPAAGSKVTLSFTLADGTQESITLTAASGTPHAGEFQLVSGDPAATAGNFRAALGDAVEHLVATRGASASAFAAADDFFYGSGGPGKPMRVDGSPPWAATALVEDDTNTVRWYTGEDSANPRSTVVARVDDGTTVRYGVQANESGLAGLVRSLSVMATASFPNDDPTSSERFDAMAVRQIDRLSTANANQPGAIKVISVEAGMARSTIASVGERHRVHKAQLETMLADMELVSVEEVAMEMLSLKTRLEASYQATALVAQLSLVNYVK